MMEDALQFLALHKPVLKTLCRVCGQCLPKNSNHIITIELMQNISCAFPDNFLEDNPDTHPKICNNCYSKAKKFVKRNSIYDAMPVLWKPNGDDCKVCSKSRREIGRSKTSISLCTISFVVFAMAQAPCRFELWTCILQSMFGNSSQVKTVNVCTLSFNHPTTYRFSLSWNYCESTFNLFIFINVTVQGIKR